MSMYRYLVCDQCKKSIHIGQAGTRDSYIYQNVGLLSRLHDFLFIDHVDHPIAATHEYDRDRIPLYDEVKWPEEPEDKHD